MTRDVLIGLDAGTSVIKAVAFDTAGRQLGAASRANRYTTLADGGVEQDMARTWDDAAAALKALAAEVEGLADRVIALSVTAQGDGTWLIDAAGRPIHDAWLWLDARAAPETRRMAASNAAAVIYETCGSGLNVCQMRTQLAAMRRTHPGLTDRAATALHCKDWIYVNLTGRRATDPTEGCFTFGDFRTRQYADAVIEGCGLGELKRLLPPIVDGAVEADALTAEAAAATGLPEGLPVTLGYVDVMCTAIGAGLHDAATLPGLSIVGSTGMHMRFVPDAGAVVLNEDRSGYTMAFPGRAFAQMQTNMAATLNIDWMLDLAIEMLASQGVARSRADLLADLDDRVMAARPGAAMFHPYISAAGERGPFAEPDARAAFTGLDQSVGWFDMMRGVYEGLAMAARDCYAAMGPLPAEIRLTGGAARSRALRAILAAALDRPVRSVGQPEAGAAGAAMIAAVQQGLYPDIAACSEAWVMPLLGAPEQPDSTLARQYDALFDAYRDTRHALHPAWTAQAAMRHRLAGVGAPADGLREAER